MSVLSSRTQRILDAPVLPLLLSLAAPNIGEAAARITGVSSAIGRALGAGEPARATSLAGVAVAIALIGAGLTTVLLLIAGPHHYVAMGLAGRPLEMAILYGGVLFGGAGFVWLMNLLA